MKNRKKFIVIMKAGRMLPTYSGYKVNNVLFRLRFTDRKDGSVSLCPVFFQYFLPKVTRLWKQHHKICIDREIYLLTA